MKRHSFRRLITALVMGALCASQVTWALAGTTGAVSGTVTDSAGAAVADASITAISSSQTAAAKTDARGSFAFLNLAPDTYTISIEKTGYNPISYAGVTIFADQNETLSFKLTKALKEIAKVSARAAGNLVKGGTTSDVYSVNQATAKQVATSAGGYNLDNAYSAIASQPGVFENVGNYNFGQVFYIRGSSYSQIGYEFDGVPVNRAFDNYQSSSLSNLGAAQTEVYTGGSPAGGSAATLGGYINQVIKTGTYPGYGDVTGSIGIPAFYHKLDVEAGGATPDRLFSWYVGLRGANNAPHFIDNQNGDDLNPNGDNKYGFQGFSNNNVYNTYENFVGSASAAGPWATCQNGVAPAGSPTLVYDGGLGLAGDPICQSYSSLGSLVSGAGFGAYGYQTEDRENIINFHFGIPHHKDAGRDDVQVLYDNYYYHSIGWDNVNTNGGYSLMEQGLTGWAAPGGYLDQIFGPGTSAAVPQYPGASTPNICAFEFAYELVGVGSGCAQTGQSPFAWGDGALLQGVAFGAPASSAVGAAKPYYFPSSPQNRAVAAGLSPNQVSGANNNGSIFKLQYTKNIGSNAFVRLFGYSFYSDWLQNNPNDGGFWPVYGFGYNPASPDYEVAYHTRGVQLQAADQINSQHLITLTGNYTASTGMRSNNSQAGVVESGSPTAILMNSGGQCFSGVANGTATRPIDGSYAPGIAAGTPVSCLSPLAGIGGPPGGYSSGTAITGTLDNVNNGTLAAAPAGAVAAGANWTVAQDILPKTNRNAVSPHFSTLALQDEWRPNDKVDLNLGVRFEQYQYQIPISSDPESIFWLNSINQTACVAPTGLLQAPSRDNSPSGSVQSISGLAGYPNYMTTLPGQACPFDKTLRQQLYHPGQNGTPLLSLGDTPTLTHSTFSPRIGATYTLNPDTVLRFTYGRYTQPTPTFAEQVLTYEDGYQQARNLYGSKYYNNGLASTIHDNPIQFSNNWDFSLEKHLKGTDVSFKLSPFYRWTSQQEITVALPGGLNGGFNAATQKSQGIELQIQKGDPTRNGLSGQISYTYTDAKIKYSLINGNNSVTALLANIDQFWSLTANNKYDAASNPNGAAPCYDAGAPVTNCASDPHAIVNPYYNLLPNTTKAQLNSQYPVDGWYDTYANFFPSDVGGDDYGTAIPQNVFSGFLAYKHNKLQASLNATLQQGNKYGAPTEVIGLDPTTCAENQGDANVVPGSQLADYQSCASAVVIPNPTTGKFEGIAQYTNPWIFNLGGQLSYDFSPRVSATLSMANLLNRCFGGSKTAWSSAFPPNDGVCSYAYNSSSYLGWSPGEAYNTAGAGFFYGQNPHDPANGTAGYPNVFNQAYVPLLGGYPFQAYFQLTVKI